MTQGPPYDEGEDLTKTSAFVKYAEAYKKGVDTLTVYTTESAMRLFPEFAKYVQSYPEYEYSEHSRGCRHGFWKWKPFLILQHLKTIEDGDILLYHDTNTAKYKEYGIDVGNLRENSIRLFTEKTCVIAALQDPFDPTLLNEKHIKPEVFHQLRSTEASIQAPMMRCNRIFIKKHKLSVNFVENWLKLCETSLLFPDKDAPAQWHTHDQALFNALYHKYVEMKLFRYPTLYFKTQIFSKDLIETTERPKPVVMRKGRSFLKFL
jgi:hypothetical protein